MTSVPERVLVTGAAGMVGSAICRALDNAGVTFSPVVRTEADLTKREEVDRLLSERHCDAVVVAAAKVGGIHANNTYPAEFIYQNLMIEANIIDGAYQQGIERLVFLGSSCIYPRHAEQPMREEALLTGALESTNEPYAIAKIAGIKLCESYNRQYGTDYRSLMPTNLYGPGDNYHLVNSHVIPALMRRFHEAKLSGASKVTVWGTGLPLREFLYVDDLADAVLHTLQMDGETYWHDRDPNCSHLNVGTGSDHSIAEIAEKIRAVVDLDAAIEFDPSKPDGTPRKLLDISQIKSLGWQPRTELLEGLRQSYRWFLENESFIRS